MKTIKKSVIALVAAAVVLTASFGFIPNAANACSAEEGANSAYANCSGN
jgi:hypothetical protein